MPLQNSLQNSYKKTLALLAFGIAKITTFPDLPMPKIDNI